MTRGCPLPAVHRYAVGIEIRALEGVNVLDQCLARGAEEVAGDDEEQGQRCTQSCTCLLERLNELIYTHLEARLHKVRI